MNYFEVAVPVPVFKTFHYSHSSALEPGCRVRVPFGKNVKTGYVTGPASPEDAEQVKMISEIIDEKPLITPALLKLARRISEYYISPPGDVMKTILPSSVKLPARKLAKEEDCSPSESGFLLSSGQEKAVRSIERALENPPGPEFLLYGVTASGKTEVYMYLASLLISRGKQLLILVPEIAITAQMLQRFRERFGTGRVALWHSQMTPVRKGECMDRLSNSGIDVLIGPRSAVFAPFRNLGAVVVDEEHDSSYKEHKAPYYDARQVARMRCGIEKALLVLSSATPSVESMHAALSGRITLLEIPEKASPGKKTEVEIVDMRGEQKGFFFSRRLLSSLGETIERGAQAIILINRRGYAPFVVCKKCGENIKCANCGTGLVYHRSNGMLLCHSCGALRRPPGKCPGCGGDVLRYSGAGTQRVKSALEKMFPGKGILRLDSDLASGNGAEKIFSRFMSRKYSVLVGTRLVAKGWDFPGVELVGVINAEAGLMVPDFRAPERVYDLLRQVKGRTGRASAAGRMIVQTLNPGHYSIRALLSGDYMNFYNMEIVSRKDSGFPPFTGLMSISSSGVKKEVVLRKLAGIKKKMESGPGTTVLGPVEVPGYSRAGHSWQILVKHTGSSAKKTLLDLARGGFLSGIRINVDPQEMQ